MVYQKPLLSVIVTQHQKEIHCKTIKEQIAIINHQTGGLSNRVCPAKFPLTGIKMSPSNRSFWSKPADNSKLNVSNN